MTAFTVSVLNLSTGDEVRLDTGLNIFSIMRKHFATWKETIENSGVTCKCISNSTLHHFVIVVEVA